MDANVKTFISENREKIGRIVLFGTSAMIKSMKKPLIKVLKNIDADIQIAEEEFHCPGSFGPTHKGRPNADDLADVKRFASEIISSNN